MELNLVSRKEYDNLVVTPFSGFDKSGFIELNKHKADKVLYFIFNNGKNRFGLVGGIKDSVLKCPFSATFGIFSEISKNNKLIHYHEALKVLIDWAEKESLNKIIICCPANFYNETHIAKMQNALFCNGFKILDYDLNFQYDLKGHTDNYIENLSSNSRRNLKIALKNGLTFEKTDDINTVYKIIKQNREEKGFPLKMSENDIIETAKIIKSDFFIVRNNSSEPVASAYIQHITKEVANIVYWGNIQKFDFLCPMNYIACQVFDYYSKVKDIKYVNIGTSTENSMPNFGLCDFKESIGCSCSPKINFVCDIT